MEFKQNMKGKPHPDAKPAVKCYCCRDEYVREDEVYAEFSIFNRFAHNGTDAEPTIKICTECAELYAILIKNHEKLLDIYPGDIEMEER